MIFSHFLSLAEECSDYVRQDAIIYTMLAYAGAVFFAYTAPTWRKKSLACSELVPKSIRGFQFGDGRGSKNHYSRVNAPSKNYVKIKNITWELVPTENTLRIFSKVKFLKLKEYLRFK